MSRKRALVQEVGEAGSPEEIRRLLLHWEGRSGEALQVVAEEARQWDSGLLLAVLASGGSLERLARNPHLPTEALSHLVTWAARRLGNEADTERVWDACRALRLLVEEGRIKLEQEPEGLAARLRGYVENPRRSGPAEHRREGALSILTADPALTREALERLARESVAHLSAAACQILILHRLASPELQEWLFREVVLGGRAQLPPHLVEQWGGDERLRRVGVAREWFRREAEVARTYRVLGWLIEDAREEDCASLFRQLLDQGRLRQAGELVGGSRGAAIARHLTQEDLMPLLASEAQELRLMAIACVGGLGAGGSKEGPEVEGASLLPGPAPAPHL